MTNEKTLPTGFKAVGVIRRSNNFTLPPINWTLWGSMYDVELWQAAALSLNINPDTIKDPTKFNHGNFKDRLRLLENWLPKNNRLMLCEFAGKWSKIFEWDIPPEIAALAKYYSELTKTETAAPAASAAKVEAVPDTSPSIDDVEEQAPAADEVEAVKRGITKQQVINAFEGLHFDRDKWSKYLADPPDWLMTCRLTPGVQGRKTSATWNPVLIAAALIDKGISQKKLDAVFVRLKDWADEWREASDYDC